MITRTGAIQRELEGRAARGRMPETGQVVPRVWRGGYAPARPCRSGSPSAASWRRGYAWRAPRRSVASRCKGFGLTLTGGPFYTQGGEVRLDPRAVGVFAGPLVEGVPW
ncbi:MAG TPA: hypothetical protein RMH99_27935 [Sandaracinaceae bacterium LLY-WYZ-13_1]|nr:hypothetical protein [Sandaracinaceae bacterium LLY-WYZ-13_1]